MDTALPQKYPFILDRNLAKANGTGNRVCTSCDTVVLVPRLFCGALVWQSVLGYCGEKVVTFRVQVVISNSDKPIETFRKTN